LRPFDFGGGKRDTIAFHEHLIARRRLAIDSDQIVFGLGLSHLAFEKFLNGRTVRDVDVIGEAAPVVIDEQDSHVVGSFG
jgi:hypothetical protein